MLSVCVYLCVVWDVCKTINSLKNDKLQKNFCDYNRNFFAVWSTNKLIKRAIKHFVAIYMHTHNTESRDINAAAFCVYNTFSFVCVSLYIQMCVYKCYNVNLFKEASGLHRRLSSITIIYYECTEPHRRAKYEEKKRRRNQIARLLYSRICTHTNVLYNV